MILNDTIAAVATPPGKGGIAVIRLSGEEAYDVAAKVFVPRNRRKSVEKCAGYAAVFGDFFYAGQVVDEGIALCFRAPNSYTGEDVIEFSCHGSDIICREILHACYEAGARPAMPGEYTKRAFLNGKMTLTQAEAVMDLVSASSRRGAQAAELALTGELQRKIENIKIDLVEAAGHLAAWIDYPEEDVEEVDLDKLQKIIVDKSNEIRDLINTYDRGMAIKRGIHAVMIGSPNVGKSTLFNLLAGMDRSIVTEIAGTTRDVVREEIHIGGMPIHLSDTAGLREETDCIESEGIRRSYMEMEQAELVIAVFDGSTEGTGKDMELARQCKDKNAIAVINKSDLEMKIDRETLLPYFEEVVIVSARDEKTREVLEDVVLARLGVGEMDPNMPLLANERQYSAALQAQSALSDAESAMKQQIMPDVLSVCLEDAIQALAQLSGEDAKEEVIEEVFSKFCVGK